MESQGWVGVGAHWVKIYFCKFVLVFMFLAQNQLGRGGEGLEESKGWVRGGFGWVHIGS